MKQMKVADVRKMAVEEIRTKISDSREELMKLRFQQVSGQLVDTSRVRALRRDVARMQTVLREAERAAVGGAQ